MSETKNDFLNELKEEFKEFGSKVTKMFEDITGKGEAGVEFSFPVEVYETGDTFVFAADLPGMTKEEIKLQVLDNNLVLSGERKKSNPLGEVNWHKQERKFGQFKRSFAMPNGVDPESIKARFDNGVLIITLSKTGSAKEESNISID